VGNRDTPKGTLWRSLEYHIHHAGLGSKGQLCDQQDDRPVDLGLISFTLSSLLTLDKLLLVIIAGRLRRILRPIGQHL
jgi:hypothetical protein